MCPRSAHAKIAQPSKTKNKDKRPKEDPTTGRAISRPSSDDSFFCWSPLIFLRSFSIAHWSAHFSLLVANPRVLFFCEWRRPVDFFLYLGPGVWPARTREPVRPTLLMGTLSRVPLFSFLLLASGREGKMATQFALAVCTPQRERETFFFFFKEIVHMYFSLWTLCSRATWGGRWRQRHACQRCRCRPC